MWEGKGRQHLAALAAYGRPQRCALAAGATDTVMGLHTRAGNRRGNHTAARGRATHARAHALSPSLSLLCARFRVCVCARAHTCVHARTRSDVCVRERERESVCVCACARGGRRHNPRSAVGNAPSQAWRPCGPRAANRCARHNEGEHSRGCGVPETRPHPHRTAPDNTRGESQHNIQSPKQTPMFTNTHTQA